MVSCDPVWSAEWISFLYFAYLGTTCWLLPLAPRARYLVTGVSLLLLGVIPVMGAAPWVIRAWAPLAYIGIAYFLTGYLFVRPSSAIESWLLGWDHRLLGNPTTRFARWPRAVVAYLDVVYMGCFLLLPAGFLALIAGGHAGQANHYWTLVAAADLGAFAPLSVLQTRPPWQLETQPTLAAPGVHRMASLMVRHATIGANTVPSGHVAVSLAVTLGVIASMPVAGVVLLVLTATIAVACVVGRYHYVFDVVSGAVWGLLVAAMIGITPR
jgi:PAP2 superfamily